MSSSPTAAIVAFLEGVGLAVRFTELPADTFLPGVSMGGGALLVDTAKLKYPGDLLHEAGHMAVMLPGDRAVCTADAGPDGGAEMAAIAWSYAAAVALGIDARVVFHAHGYRQGGEEMAANFEQGRTMGVPLLQWFGMTTDQYPAMTKWLRDETSPR